MAQYFPRRAWLWKRWRGTIVRVVLPREWPQKAAFLAALDAELAPQPTCPAYYLGARARRAALRRRYAALEPSRARHVRAPPAQPEGAMCDDDEARG